MTDATLYPDLPPGYRLFAFDTIDSTNAEARRAAEAGDAGGLVVWAREQAAGRGRRGRNWASPPGNLYCSLLLRAAIPASRAGEISILAAVSAGEAVSEWVSGAVALKWPNDVLLNGRKVAGVLTESAAAGALLDWVVIGCGINLASHPNDTRWPASNLEQEGGTVPPETVLLTLIVALDRWYRRWMSEGFGPVRQAWSEMAFGRDGNIELAAPDGPICGRVTGLSPEGALLLETATGRRVVHSGEIKYHEAASCC